jgi:hypothetical protein
MRDSEWEKSVSLEQKICNEKSLRMREICRKITQRMLWVVKNQNVRNQDKNELKMRTENIFV